MATQKTISFDINSGKIEISESPILIPDVNDLKTAKKAEIKNSFNQAFLQGKAISGLSIGEITLDCRREDLDNMRTLLAVMQRNYMTLTTIRDFNNQDHTVTLADVGLIVADLENYGIYLYGKKFQLDTAVDSITQEQMISAHDAAVADAMALPESEEKQQLVESAEINFNQVFNNIVW